MWSVIGLNRRIPNCLDHSNISYIGCYRTRQEEAELPESSGPLLIVGPEDPDFP